MKGKGIRKKIVRKRIEMKEKNIRKTNFLISA